MQRRTFLARAAAWIAAAAGLVAGLGSSSDTAPEVVALGADMLDPVERGPADKPLKITSRIFNVVR